jgi:hypothetical protein
MAIRIILRMILLPRGRGDLPERRKNCSSARFDYSAILGARHYNGGLGREPEQKQSMAEPIKIGKLAEWLNISRKSRTGTAGNLSSRRSAKSLLERRKNSHVNFHIEA